MITATTSRRDFLSRLAAAFAATFAAGKVVWPEESESPEPVSGIARLTLGDRWTEHVADKDAFFAFTREYGDLLRRMPPIPLAGTFD